MNNFPYFIYFLTIRVQQDTENMHDNILSDGEFRENRWSESHSLYGGVNEYLSLRSTFIFQFGLLTIVH
jgi:hypothetical protein